MGGRASTLAEIVICFGGVVRQGICESRFFLKLGTLFPLLEAERAYFGGGSDVMQL
jgi:hypothetical protein